MKSFYFYVRTKRNVISRFYCFWKATQENDRAAGQRGFLTPILLFQVTRELLYSLIIPLPCLFVSIVYILIAYFYIYRDPPEVSKSHKMHLCRKKSNIVTVHVTSRGASN